MARSQIGTITSDLQSDSGSVLWSLVQGEQLEFSVTLNFISNVGAGYIFEAVIIEALNVSGNSDIPTVARPSGVETTLTVRVPTDRGTWAAGTAYDREDVVLYSAVYYKLSSGSGRIDPTLPNADPLWEVYVPNKVYIQFPALLATTPTYAVQPTSVSPVYGFFELRVTEPSGGVYTRTWKPMRGLVEILYSPTNIV